MSAFLVWGVCFGDRCRALAPRWLRALTDIAGWRHDIVLLGDARIASLTHPRLKAIDLARDVQTRFPFLPEPWPAKTPTNLKPQIQFYVDLRRYDYLLYLDLDVLANNDRLEALVQSKCRRGVISVQQDIIPISAGKTFTGRDTLSPEEKRRWADEAICAGMVGLPTHAAGLALLRDWQAANRERKLAASDQANLIALLLRQYAGRWEYLGDTAIGRRLHRYDAALVHFSAGKDGLLRDYYRDILRLPEPEHEGPRDD